MKRKKQKKIFYGLFLVLLLVRGLSLVLPAWEKWVHPPFEYDLEKLWKERAAARKKIMAEAKKQFLLDLEELRKKYEWELRIRDLEKLLEGMTVLSDDKVAVLLKLDIPDGKMAEEGGAEVVSEQELQKVVQSLLKIKPAPMFLPFEENSPLPPGRLSKFKFSADFIAEEKVGSAPVAIWGRPEHADRYEAGLGGASSSFDSAWSEPPSGFLFGLIIGLIQLISGLIEFLVMYKEIFIILAFLLAAVLSIALFSTFVRRRY